jgi:hypothetical protein
MEWGIADVRPGVLAALAAWTVGLSALAWASGRLAPPWRAIVRGIVLFLALRVLLFGNPWAWSVYEANLRARYVGWRQMSVIREELRADLRPPRGVRFLAVGSSQTDALYDRIAREREDLRVFGLAGLFPLDFVLYQDRIAEYRPEVVLLYLSEFDLARVHDAERAVLAPPQGLRLVRLARTILALPGGERYRRALAEMAVGEVFPEYRFGFVFRGLRRKIQGGARVEARAAPDEGPVERASPEALAREIANLRGGMSAEQIDFNLPFLREFLEACGRWGSRVVIVEGRLAPGVSDEAMRKMNERVARELRALDLRYEHVVFIPRAEQPPIEDGDWVDASHVRREAGRAWAERMLNGDTRLF